MIKTFAIAALAVVTFAGTTVSSARAEPSKTEIAAGLAAAVVGGLVIGKTYQNYKNKRDEKKINKKALRNMEQLKKDSAGDADAFKAKWAPRCQKVIADLKAANCTGQKSLKCSKIAADCPL